MTAEKGRKRKPPAAKPVPVEAADWKATFLAAFEQTGNVSSAARIAGVSRQHAYRVRGEDPAFAGAWDESNEVATGSLEAEAVRRARDGTLRPVFHAGKKCGEVREYSDTLLIFLLKARDPAKYRENARLEVAGDPANPLAVAGSIDVLAEIERLRPAFEDVADRMAPITTQESSHE